MHVAGQVLEDVRVADARAYELSQTDFDELRGLVKTYTGISLSETKRELVKRRFTPRLRALGLDGFDAYIRYVHAYPEDELMEFASAITTNLTSFFRERHHFDYLTSEVVPQLLQSNRSTRRIRVWCSAASTGQEPYSIAMTLLDAIPDINAWDLRILATDIDRACLERADSGIYDLGEIEQVSSALRARWFLRGTGSNAGKAKVRDALKRFVQFRPLNLIGSWPISGPVDVIFCRNVFIYFDKAQQKQIMDRYSRLQAPGAYLFLGHSESLHNLSRDYRLVAHTVYRRV